MATLAELEAALRKAHAAGNADHARAFANAIRQMRSQQGQAGGAPQLPPELADLPVPGYPGTPSPMQPAAAPQGDNLLSQGLSGANEGIAGLLGAPVDATSWLLNQGISGANTAMGTDIPQISNPIGGAQSIEALMGDAIGPDPTTGAGQFTRRVGQDVGAALVPAVGMAGQAARPGLMIAKELGLGAGAGTGAAVANQLAPDNPLAEILGQLAGAGTVAGASGAARRAITPFEASPHRIAAADALMREGVDLTAGQRTGSQGLRYAESELGGMADMTDLQAEQFTSAALSRAGVSGNRATPEVMSEAYENLGNQFDDLAARNTITGDQQLVQDLGDTWSEYTSLVNESERAPIIESTIRDVANAIQQNNGTITGEAYKSLRSRLGRALKGSKDPELKFSIRSVQDALDGAMERSMQAAGSPDLGAWQQVRSDYANFKILEDAAAGAGEAAAMGIISPARLRSAIARQNKGAYVRGQGDFAELARSGVATMNPLPQSGTAPRTAVRNMFMGLPTIAGAGLGGASGDVMTALMGAGVGAAVPSVVGRAIASGPGQRYLGNQLLTGVNSGATGAGVAGALAAGQTPELSGDDRIVRLLMENAL